MLAVGDILFQFCQPHPPGLDLLLRFFQLPEIGSERLEAVNGVPAEVLVVGHRAGDLVRVDLVEQDFDGGRVAFHPGGADLFLQAVALAFQHAGEFGLFLAELGQAQLLFPCLLAELPAFAGEPAYFLFEPGELLLQRGTVFLGVGKPLINIGNLFLEIFYLARCDLLLRQCWRDDCKHRHRQPKTQNQPISTRLCPVISAGCSRLIRLSRVGATSLRLPSSLRLTLRGPT